MHFHAPSISSAAGLSEQSSILKLTRPVPSALPDAPAFAGVAAGFRADATHSTDFLSIAFIDRSKNCKFFARETNEPRILNAGAFSRLFDATERKLSVFGMRRACKIGFRFWILA